MRVPGRAIPLAFAALVAAGAVRAQTAGPRLDLSPIVVLHDTVPTLLQRWDARAEVLKTRDPTRARTGLAEVSQALLDAGVQGVPGGFQAPAIAGALVRQARRAFDAGDAEVADALLDAAKAAAPDLLSVSTERVWMRVRGRDLRGAVSALRDVVAVAQRDPSTTALVGARALLALCGVWLALLVVSALCNGLPALRLLVFDLHLRLPRGATANQVRFLVVLAAFTPLVAGAGPVFGTLWMLTMSCLYLTLRERIIATALALGCIALPVSLDLSARLLAFPASRAAEAVRGLTDMAATDVIKDLQAATGELTMYEQLALAQAAKRAGDLDLAASRYEALVKVHDHPLAHAGYGVVAALQGNEDRAVQEFERATAVDARAWVASFNVSAFHFRRGRVDLAAAAGARLSAEAPELLFTFREATFREVGQQVTHNRAFVDIAVHPHDVLIAGLEPSALSEGVAVSFERALFAGLPRDRAVYVIAAFPCLWLILFAARKWIGPSRACVRCGSPASKRVNGRNVPLDTCSPCFHAFVSTKTRIDAEIKRNKERDIAARRKRVARTVIAFGLAWPGVGHLLGNATLRGFAFVGVHATGMVCTVLASGLVPIPILENAWWRLPLIIAIAVVMLVVWLLGIRSSLSVARDARAGRG